MSSFVAELIDSLAGTLEDSYSAKQQLLSADLLNKIKLEINSSKLVHNIPAEEISNHLFTAFLSLPCIAEKFTDFTKTYKHFSSLWKVYFKTTADQSQVLFAMEEKAIRSDGFRRILPKVLYFLSQDVNALDDDLIVDWFSNLGKDSPLKREEKMAELVTWLQDAEESSETDDEEGEDE